MLSQQHWHRGCRARRRAWLWQRAGLCRGPRHRLPPYTNAWPALPSQLRAGLSFELILSLLWCCRPDRCGRRRRNRLSRWQVAGRGGAEAAALHRCAGQEPCFHCLGLGLLLTRRHTSSRPAQVRWAACHSSWSGAPKEGWQEALPGLGSQAMPPYACSQQDGEAHTR